MAQMETSPRPTHARAELAVHHDGAWFQLAGTASVAWVRRTVRRRLLVALVRARLDTPARPVTADQLIRAGWPDERILPRAARNRLHVALHRLRRSGLAAVVRRTADGWLLSTDLAISLCDDAGAAVGVSPALPAVQR
jgi:hypothetical protein